GTVAGARCGSGGACAAGLTCSPPSPGVCSAAAVTDCDPLGGTTRCSAGQACLASSSVRGRCGAQGVETEPNDTAALSAARAVSTPSAFVGALAYGDVDCVPVVVPAGGNLVAFVSDGNGRCPVTSGALALDLYDTDGVTVRLTTTQNGPGLCAHMDGGRRSVFPSAGGLVAGTYTVCARGVQSSTVRTANVASYVLTVAATP
ncbi:MAG: hypothetical protein JWM10_566, partial [Myxococcaceae bacterium]|nr:hypothetical protein [Myxococcaceae bacterium]